MIRRWDKSRPPTSPFVLNENSDRAQGLYAWWPMAMSGAGFIPDLRGNNHFLTTTGTVGYPGDVGEPTYSLNGSTELATISRAINPTTPIAYGAWIRPSSLPASVGTIIAQGASGSDIPFLYLGLLSTGAVRMGNRGDDSAVASVDSAATTASANKWSQVGGVGRASADQAVFVNGAVTTGAVGQINAFTMNRTVIGALVRTSTALYFPGLIGEVCMWNQYKTNLFMQNLADPSRRFELWYPLRSRKWISAGAAAAATLAWARSHRIPQIGMMH